MKSKRISTIIAAAFFVSCATGPKKQVDTAPAVLAKCDAGPPKLLTPPAQAKAIGPPGTVTMTLNIDVKGNVLSVAQAIGTDRLVYPSDSNDVRLVQAAFAAAKKAKFAPCVGERFRGYRTMKYSYVFPGTGEPTAAELQKAKFKSSKWLVAGTIDIPKGLNAVGRTITLTLRAPNDDVALLTKQIVATHFPMPFEIEKKDVGPNGHEQLLLAVTMPKLNEDAHTKGRESWERHQVFRPGEENLGLPLTTRIVFKGSLSKKKIQDIIRAAQADIRLCYERALQNNLDLDGKVVINFTITGTGAVTTAKVAEETIGSEVAECVVEVVRGLEFPAPTGGGSIFITYPWSFSSK